MGRWLLPSKRFSGSQVQDLASKPWVTEDPAHRAMARQTPEPVLLPIEERTSGVEFFIIRIGILNKVRIPGIQRYASAPEVNLHPSS
jgi:hypothetical protein